MAKKLLETWSNCWLRIARSPKGGVVCTPLVQRHLEDAFQLHTHSTRTGNTGSTRWVSPHQRKPLIARSLLPRKCLAQKLPRPHFHRDHWPARTDRRQLHHLILFLSVSTLFLLLLGIDMASPEYQEQGLDPRRPTTLTRRLALGAGESCNRSRLPGGRSSIYRDGSSQLHHPIYHHSTPTGSSTATFLRVSFFPFNVYSVD